MKDKTQTEPTEGLRQRTRRAVRGEIADAAVSLFVERGFEETTIDDIAAAVGMSQRSIFRYFATKEEIIVGKLDLGADAMIETLRSRPIDEPIWTSIRRAFDIVDERGDVENTKQLQRLVFDSPALLATYLHRLHTIQARVSDTLLQRARTGGAKPNPTQVQSIVAAGFGCLVAAQQGWLDTDSPTPLGDLLDEAMAAVAPTGT